MVGVLHVRAITMSELTTLTPSTEPSVPREWQLIGQRLLALSRRVDGCLSRPTSERLDGDYSRAGVEYAYEQLRDFAYAIETRFNLLGTLFCEANVSDEKRKAVLDEFSCFIENGCDQLRQLRLYRLSWQDDLFGLLQQAWVHHLREINTFIGQLAWLLTDIKSYLLAHPQPQEQPLNFKMVFKPTVAPSWPAFVSRWNEISVLESSTRLTTKTSSFNDAMSGIVVWMLLLFGGVCLFKSSDLASGLLLLVFFVVAGVLIWFSRRVIWFVLGLGFLFGCGDD